MSSEYDLPESARRILAPYLVDFELVMVELGAFKESDLKGTDICRNFPPDRLRRELRRALYYLMSVTDKDQESEVRQALQSIQDEILLLPTIRSCNKTASVSEIPTQVGGFFRLLRLEDALRLVETTFCRLLTKAFRHGMLIKSPCREPSQQVRNLRAEDWLT